MDKNIKDAINKLKGKEVNIFTRGAFISFSPLDEITFLKKQDIYPYESIYLSTKISYNNEAKASIRICIYDDARIKLTTDKIIFNKGLKSEIAIIFQMGEC